MMKFYAAFKGVDLDKGSKDSNQERFEKIEKRAERRRQGLSPDELDSTEAEEFAEFGIDFE